MNILKTLLLLLIIFSLTYAQNNSIYYPPNFKNAIRNGTRTFDGKPGKNYWINKTSYKIKAAIDIESRTLNGSETIEYINNSPKTLYTIVIRLYQDFYKKGNSRDFQIPAAAITDGVKINKLIVGDDDLTISRLSDIPRQGTNLFIKLKSPLASGTKINIEIDWSFIIPKLMNLRMGTYDKSSFFIGHWYPQVAVFDDIDGWDTENYNGMLEFYNDFNDFDVEITMPKDFIVWATGELQNPREVLASKYYDRYKAAKFSDKIVSIIDSLDLKEKGFTPKKDKLVWNYKAENVPDFAFATSDNYLWDLGSLQLNDNEKRILVGAAYKKESADFYKVAEISRNSLLYFSKDMPSINYPWPSMLIFNGHGGMEFPMMVNDGSTSSMASTVGLTSHEIAHTYFPFYTGTSERKYAFMDEGWAVMLPFEFQAKEGKYNPVARQVSGYEQMAGSEFDLPLIIPSSAASISPYRQMVYRRAGLAYWFLMDALGKDLFTEAVKEYISRWKEKHPTPFDFYHTFENVVGKELNWFWKPWFFEYGAPDLALGDVIRVRNTYRVEVKKEGNIPVPIKLTIFFNDGSTKTHYERCNIWENEDLAIIEINSAKKAVKIELGSADIPDVNKKNNKTEL